MFGVRKEVYGDYARLNVFLVPIHLVVVVQQCVFSCCNVVSVCC